MRFAADLCYTAHRHGMFPISPNFKSDHIGCSLVLLLMTSCLNESHDKFDGSLVGMRVRFGAWEWHFLPLDAPAIVICCFFDSFMMLTNVASWRGRNEYPRPDWLLSIGPVWSHGVPPGGGRVGRDPSGRPMARASPRWALNREPCAKFGRWGSPPSPPPPLPLLWPLADEVLVIG